MSEIETTEQEKDTPEKTGEEDTDTSKNNDGGADDTEEGADDTENDEGSDEETDDDKEDDDDKKSKSDTSKKDDEEPPTRKRPIDFIKERQAKKQGKQADKSKENEDEDTEDDVDPEDEKTIGKVVKKYLDPLIQKEVEKQDEAEITSFLTENPDFKPYEARARKYMSHPSRKDVPIEEIFYSVAGKDLLRIGAKRAKIADDEAKKSKTGGGTGDAGGVKPNSELSREELIEKQNKVREKMADRY